MSQWAEIRQMHVVDGVPKKQIAERLGLDIKTVRRAVAQAAAPARRAVSRPRHLDRWRAQIEQWLRQDRRLTAKRSRRLLLPLAGPVAERTVRWYVARLKAAAAPKDVYVHRSPRPGVTLEVDFGESWAEVAGVAAEGQVCGGDPCTAPGFLDSGLTVFASTRPRPAHRGRVAPGRGFDSRISPASTARCMSV